MDVGPCPRCTETVRPVIADEFCCFGCFYDVKLLCSACGIALEFSNRNQFPKFCDDCAAPVRLDTVRRVAYELSCHNCPTIIQRKKNGDLPKYCSQCQWKIDKSKLRYRSLAGNVDVPAADDKTMAAVDNEGPIRSVSTTTTTTGTHIVSNTEHLEPPNRNNEPLHHVEAVAIPPAAAPSHGLPGSPVVTTAALTGSTDSLRSQLPFETAAATTSAVERAQLLELNEDGHISDLAAGVDGAGKSVRSSIATEPWNTRYHEGAIVSRHAPATIRAEILPESWSRGPPAGTTVQTVAVTVPKISNRLGPDATVLGYGGSGRGINEIGAVNVNRALTVVDTGDVSPDFPYVEHFPISRMRGPFHPFVDPDLIYHFDNAVEGEIWEDENDFIEPNVALPVLNQETVALTAPNDGMEMVNIRSAKRKRRRWMRKDHVLVTFDTMSPHANHSAFRDEGLGRRHMAFFDADIDPLPEMFSPIGRSGSAEAKPNAIPREYVDVNFHVVISESFSFDEKFDSPFIELYSHRPEEPPIRSRLLNHSLLSGQPGWTVVIRFPQNLYSHGQPLQYRYGVQHASVRDQDTYEWIHKQAEGETCSKRHLWLSDIPAGMDKWDQYDLVMLPESYALSDASSVLRHPQTVLSRDAASKGVRVLRHLGPGTLDNTDRTLYDSIMADSIFGLYSMLPDFMYCITNGNIMASSVIECFEDVLNCVVNGKLYFLDDANRSVDQKRLHMAICTHLVERAKQQESLGQRSMDQPVAGDKYSRLLRIVSGLVLMVLSCLYRCDGVFEHLSGILASLSIADLSMSDVEDFVQKHFKNPSRVVNSLRYFMMEAANSGDPSWLWAVPLYHAVQKWATSYDRRSAKFKNHTWWGLDPELGRCLSSFMAQARQFKVKDWYQRLSPMFRVSWLSARTLVYALNKVQLLSALSEQLPLPIDGYTAAVLHNFFLRNRPQHPSNPQSPKEGVSAFNYLRDILTKVCDSTQINNPWTTASLLNSLDIIVDALFKAEHHIDFRGWQLILEITCFFADLCKFVPPPVDKPFDTSLVMRFIDEVMDWLSHVLNFPMAEVDATTFTNADELEMWRLLMGLEWHEKEIRQIWTLRLKQSLHHRLDKASHYTKVALYCLTDFNSSDIEEIFVAMALQAAGDVMRNIAKEIDYGGNNDARRKYGKVFSFAFNEAWKRLSADDAKKIEFIYTWPRFHTYVSLICSDHALVLDQACQSRMDECVKLLEQRCSLLRSGGITYSDLNFMIQHDSQFVRICRLLSEKQYIDERIASDIHKWLELRKKEKSTFDELHDNLRKFVAMCERIDKVQLLDLPRRLSEDLSQKPLSDLWVPSQPDRPGVLECRQFPFTKTVLTPDFLQLVKKVHESLLFMSYWTSAGKLFLKQREESIPKDAGMPIELKDVRTAIWDLAYGQYTDFVKRLELGTATFGDADYLVKLCGGDAQRLSDRIATEVKLVMQSSANWKEVRHRIVDYNKLRLYANGASVMRKLKNLFDLHGDFRALDVLITWDQDPSRKLVEITDKLVEAGRRLGAMDDQAKVECLNAFVECKDLIDWVREHVTEPKELKVFVDLASIVAGEGDIEVEKVTCLHAAVIGYTPLIYELPQTADLQTFLEKCEAVWKSLETNKDLAIQLKDTARNIEFIKSVKESYSSVELSSLAQAGALNEKGSYTVGFVLHDVSAGYLSSTLDSVVRAAVPDTRRPVSSSKEQLSQKTENQMVVDDSEKKYSYSALSELQSKLMLVAGQAVDNHEVEEFVKMFRNITRLAEAYVRVNDVGTLLFEKWQMKFANGFAVDGHQEKIAWSHVRLELSAEKSEVVEYHAPEPGCADHAAKLADLLEECANEWDNYVREQRQKYHELNFFTIRQIVYLRKELAKCLTSGKKIEKKCSNKVYPLLAMLAPCNWEDVAEALNESSSPSVDLLSLSPKSDSVKVLSDNQGGCSSFDELVSKLREKWKEFLDSRLYDAQEFISTERLGCVLRHLFKKYTRPSFPTGLARGQPHLVVCPEDDVLRALLSLYMVEQDSPMPTRNEVLVCSEQTSLEEVELLLQRALVDEVSLYSVVHAQRLSYDICGHIEKRIEEFQGLNKQYCIAVLCAEESEGRSRILTALERFRMRRFTAEPIEKLRVFVQTHLQFSEGAGALIDTKKCSARVIRSNRAGVGKTLYIRRRIEKLKSELPTSDDALCIQLLQQRVDLSAFLRKFLDISSEPKHYKCRLVHINISQEVQYGVDELLFNLLILGSLCHSDGYVWQRSKFDYYAIEAAPLLKKMQTTDGEKWKAVHSVLELLPSLSCVSPSECYHFYGKASADSTDDVWREMDDQVFQSEEWQRTYQYLKRNRESFQDAKDVNASSPEGSPKDMLCVLLDECKLHDPSWCELRNFVSFLNMQLLDCERSAFCSAAAREDLPRFLEFVVSFMLDMSRDFATRSLVISEESPETQLAQLYQGSGETILGAMEVKRRWESSPHPYIFFNPDHQTLTFLGFCVERRNGNILVPRTAQILKHNAVAKELFDGLERNNVDLSEDFESKTREEKIQKICAVMGNDEPRDPNSRYELTLDNVKKILAIQMRFRCGIPVVIMGETGCGKTYLVKFMCDLQIPKSLHEKVKNLILMKVHGGTTAQDIERKVREAQKIAQENKRRNIDTVLFFDEANTTDAIGLIKEIMCDGSLNGEFLNANNDRLRFIAAVNPYRKHSRKMIEKLEAAGLGYNVKADDTLDRFGSIPMRHLVYRVKALPQSMIPLVWDFGRLSSDVEEKYICQMISKYDGLRDTGFEEAIARVLVKCQDFMRLQKDECGFVSLRDVDRVLTVMSWFLEKHHLLREINSSRPIIESTSLQSSTDSYMAVDSHTSSSDSSVSSGSAASLSNVLALNKMSWSLVLALGVCYHAGLNPRKRAEFRRVVASHFRHPLVLPQGDRQMLEEIESCQSVIVDSLKDHLPENVARNHALKENIFMMVVCLDQRIPLFLVGKPGSSKSLAKVVVADAMQGDSAKSELFKALKHVHMLSFQCSPLSTHEGIVATFRQCARFQRKNNLDKFVSVVVLDEVGLAEDSKHMPLKALHPLLEEGCDVDEKKEKEEKELDVDRKGSPEKDKKKDEDYRKCAFIGISNWALDPAKMNRGIHVQRGVPDRKELEESARGILEHDQRVTQAITTWIGPLAAAYLKICEDSKVPREFFGLRDFYSLMKMIAYFAIEERGVPTTNQVHHAILRNFGGVKSLDVMSVFQRQLHSLRSAENTSPHGPPCDAIGLIDSSLTGTFTKSGGESRYLLILTENDTALSLVQSKLQNSKPEVIFGSFFPKDLEYTQVCRNINRIKVCMEAGKTVILLNLENLYESLYDALNQYYNMLGGKRFVDLGLGTHRVKCRVHESFRLIVIADKHDVLTKFPVPLINRLEKHYVKMSSILTERQQGIVLKLCRWASGFVEKPQLPSATKLRMSRPSTDVVIEPEDAFVGYSTDAVAAVLLQIPSKEQESLQDPQLLKRAKEILLLSATPDAVLRVKQSRLSSDYDEIFGNYFEKENHDCFSDLISNFIKKRPSEDLFLQVTTHYRLFSRDDVNQIKGQLDSTFGILHVISALQAIDTEQQFSKEIRDFYKRTENTGLDALLIVQCEAGHENMKLISCARYILWREYNDSQSRLENFKMLNPDVPVPERRSMRHVVLMVQLQRKAKFFGFHGAHWTCVHIDDLHSRPSHLPAIKAMHRKTISEVLDSGLPESPQATPGSAAPSGTYSTKGAFDTYELLRSSLHEAVSRLSDSIDGRNPRSDNQERRSRARTRLALLINLFSSDQHQVRSKFQEVFSRYLIRLISLHENNRLSPEMRIQWLFVDAASIQNVIKFGTFRRSLENCLERRIASFFATIVAFLDTNGNLDLLAPLTSNDDHWVSRLWLDIFAGVSRFSSDLAQTLASTGVQNYDVHEVQKYEVPVICTSASNESFSPRFPFSWVLKGQLDAMIVQLKDSPETFEDLHNRMLSWLERDGTFACITREAERHLVDMVESYLHDFVHLAFPCKGSRPEFHKIMCKSLLQIMVATSRQTIPGIHLCSSEIQRRTQRLRKLIDLEVQDPHSGDVPLEKEVLNYLEKHETPEVVSDLAALLKLLDRLEPSISKKELFDWAAKMHQCYMLVEEVLSDVGNESDIERPALWRTCREHWWRYVVLLLFLEMVVNRCRLHPDLSQLLDDDTVKLLSQRLSGESDFKQLTALKNLEGFLEYCNRQVVNIIYGKHFMDNECCSGGHDLKDPTLLPCQHPICGSCLQLVIFNQNEESRCPIPTCNRRIPMEFARSPRNDFDDEYSAKVQRHQIFKHLLNSFFVRVLVELVFSGNDPPDAAVMQHILRYVTSEHRTGDRTLMRTKQLSPFIDITLIDPTPVIRSFLLQLLLRTSEGLVKKHLSQYFNTMTTVTESLGSHVVLEFCILFITCFEDYVAEKTLGSNTTSTTLAVPREACNYVRDTLDPNGQARLLFDGVMPVDVDSLRAIAVLRLCLTIGADIICRHLLTMPQHSSNRDLFAISQLLSDICDYAENKGNSWPRRFLAKQIIRKHGAIVFHAASSAQHLRYIIPKELQQTAGRAPLSDLFVIGLNKEVYEEIRTAVAHCVLDTKMDALPNVIKGRQSAKPEMDLHCVLAICSVFIRNYFLDKSASCIGDEVKKMVEHYAAQQWPEVKVLQQLIGGIVKNSLTDRLQIVMSSSINDVMVVMLVHRLAAGLLVKERSSAIVNPLTKILATPLEMQKAYFPTMPHDPFLEVKEVIKTSSSDSENLLPYACPNGHIYYIGNCGRAYELSKCPECGSVIGGTSHITADGNRDVKLGEDNTKPGHILGLPGVTKQIIPERNLTPQSCIIMRAVLHSALYVSAVVNGKEQVEQLVLPRPENLLQFLWNHLRHDIECLQLALSKSFDDCLIFLHTVVARLVTLEDEDDCSWSTHDGRRTWESKLQKCLLLPLCQEADRIIAEGAAALHTNVDSSAGAMALARLLDESRKAENVSSMVNLSSVLNSDAVWRYRESPSVDHFINRFENSNSFDAPLNNERSHKYSALKLFLRTRVQLAAVRFLPDILSLISSLSREFGRKIDVATANGLSIGQFLGKYVEDRKSYYRPLINSFYEAWNAVSGRLGQHTFWYGRRRLNMSTETCVMIKASDDSPLCMLLPGMAGLGLCTLTLVTYLAKMQNDFLSEYARITREGLQEDTPLLCIIPVQLIAFVGNDDLLPIILANCEYSLKAGEGMSLQYNFESIQSQIMDRFVRHKPPIWLSSEENGVDAIQCFTFREDLRNGNQFEKLHRVLAQKPLPPQLKESMQKEYNGKVSELSDMLVVIDQAVGFLVTSAISDDSSVALVGYLDTVLHMPDIRANVMWAPLRENCFPCHVRAVWLLLSLERAKALTKNKQECFDDLETTYRLPIGEQESAAVNLVNFLKKQKHEMLAEKVSEILYEFIVLKLACKRRKADADSDADDDASFPPHYPLFCTLSEYAEKTAESTGIGEAFIDNLKKLGQDYLGLHLEHSAAVWRRICDELVLKLA